ncbi:MAG TPA: tetratricopeptide repeat protein [Terracidiphilus sp.]|nr:tetratricopeptide repeat protein [Terracidiphilus sp.]
MPTGVVPQRHINRLLRPSLLPSLLGALILCAALAAALPAAFSQCTPPPSIAAELKAQPDASVYAKLGNWFASRNQPACAADAFGKAVAMQPDSANYAYLWGLSLSSAGQPRQAIAPLEQSLRIDPTSIDAHLVLGSVLSRLGRRADADAQWRFVLSLDAKSSAALESLSRDLLVDGNYVSVIDLLRPVEASGQLSAASAINLSVAYTKAGLLSNAYDVLQPALHANPSSLPLIEALSAVLVMLDRYQDAAQMLSVVARQHAGDEPLQIQYLHVLVLAGDPAAEPLCQRLLKADPDHWELLYLMGLLRQNAHDLNAARTWFEKSVARKPDYADSHFHLGSVLAALHDNSAARQQLEKAIALGFHEPQVHFELGRAYRALGNDTAAQQQFQQYQQDEHAELNKEIASDKYRQADQAQAAGNYSQAAEYYRQALSVDPNEPLLAYRLAMALDKTGDVAGERTALEQAINDNPQMAVAQNQLGYLDFSAGNTEPAIKHFQLAVQADPDFTKAWMNLAAALCVQSKWEDARSALRHVLELDPGSAPAHQLLQRIDSIEIPQPTR